ncbi:bile acid:sodium symporter family protein [Streptomyces sp. NPDC052042]|uniref:bile acid:sodium symporter family protein n=1 Tax=Streptomyces sp. NPDC052042 TaxID=3365683 RepID=UPI0037D274B8
MSRRTPRMPPWLPVDPYILALIATIAVAAVLPASGAAAEAAGGASTGAIALLFFLYGARLSTAEVIDGLRHWRLHLTVLACTFVVFPLLGLAARGLVPYVLTPQLHSGFLFLCLVPSTVQSSIAFTSIARGNVPAAICAGSFSSIAGIFLTPLLAAALLGSSGGGFSADALLRTGVQLLLPFVAGQLLRRWIGGFLVRHKKILGHVDRGSILLVVYTAFSEGVVMGIWHQVTPARLAGLLAAEALLLALMLMLTWYGAKRIGFDREDRIAIQFAGSKKSLASGLPMASVLFGAQASLAVLPLMLFHQMQLMVCAVLAKRRSRDEPEAGPERSGTSAAPGDGGEPEAAVGSRAGGKPRADGEADAPEGRVRRPGDATAEETGKRGPVAEGAGTQR